MMKLPSDAGEDDIRCGVCGQQFTDILLFIRHKKTCASRPGKKSAVVKVPTSILNIGSSLRVAFTETSSCTVGTAATYNQVDTVDKKAVNIQSGIVSGSDTLLMSGKVVQQSVSSPPFQFLLADQINQNQGGVTADTMGSNSTHLDRKDDLSWSTPGVLGTMSLSDSLKQLHSHRLSILMESSQDHCNSTTISHRVSNSREAAQHQIIVLKNLQNCDGCAILAVPVSESTSIQLPIVEDIQPPTELIGPLEHDLPDVEDVESVLANHATFDSISSSINTSESFAGHSTLKNQPNLLVSVNYVDKEKTPLQSITQMIKVGVSKQSTKFMNDVCKERMPAEKSKGDNVTSKPAMTPEDTLVKLICKTKSAKFKSVSKTSCFAEKTLKHAKKEVKIYYCQYPGCQYQATSTRDVTRHTRKHTGEKPFVCGILHCGRAFARADKLRIHMKIHSDSERPFKCDLCDFSSRERGGLTLHKKVHMDERRYVCQICNHRSRTNAHLQVHVRSHSGEHPYMCNFCGKTFKQSSDLARHARYHLCECEECDFLSQDQRGLDKHKLLNHSRGVARVCPVCNELSPTYMDMQEHVKIHDANSKFCNRCVFVCAGIEQLNVHMRLHKRKQPKQNSLLCEKKGKTLALAKVPSKALKVPWRKKKTKKVDDELPEIFNCTYCSEAFWREDALEVHLQDYHLDDLVAPCEDGEEHVESDSRETMDSDTMDNFDLADLESDDAENDDDLQKDEILAVLNRASDASPEFEEIHGGWKNVDDELVAFPSPLMSLSDDPNALSLLP